MDALITYASLLAVTAMIGFLATRIATALQVCWVVPRHTARIATSTARLVVKLIDPRELVTRVDATRLTAEIEQPLLRTIDNIVRDVLNAHHPDLWESLPAIAQDLAVKPLQVAYPQLVEQVVGDIDANIDTLLDLEQLVVTRLTREDGRLTAVIGELAVPPRSFVIRSGLILGIAAWPMGVLLLSLTSNPALLAAFGLGVGVVAPWVARSLLFRPRAPHNVFGRIVQGHLHRRRERTAQRYGDILATEVLTVPNLIDAMLTGPGTDTALEIVHRAVATGIDQHATISGRLVGNLRLAEMKRDATSMVIAQVPRLVRMAQPYLTNAFDVAGTISRRLMLRSAADYEEVLRPALTAAPGTFLTVGGLVGAAIATPFAFLLP